MRKSAGPGALERPIVARPRGPATAPTTAELVAFQLLMVIATRLTGKGGALVALGALLYAIDRRFGGQLAPNAARALGQALKSSAGNFSCTTGNGGADLRSMLPSELWIEIFQFLPRRDLLTLSKVDRSWQVFVESHFSGRGSAFMLEGHALSQLAKHSSTPVRRGALTGALVSQGMGQLSFLIPRGAAPRGRLPEITQLLGCPPSAEGKGGSGILGLPPTLRDPALAVVAALAGRDDGDYWLMACINALREDPSQSVTEAIRSITDQPLSSMKVLVPYSDAGGTVQDHPISRMNALLNGGLATKDEIAALCGRPGEHTSAYAPLTVVLCEMARRATTGSDIQGLIGRATDPDGYGGIGILSLPRDLQVYPLRLLNLTMFERHRSGSPYPAEVFDMIAGPTASNGDPLALRFLCESGALVSGAVSIESLRQVWTVVCTPPDMAHASSLKDLLGLLSKFPMDERVASFGQHLSAWESLVGRDPARLLGRSFDTVDSIKWFDHRSSIDDGLTKTLQESVPEAFHEEGGHRIAALRGKIWSTACLTPDFEYAGSLRAMLPALSKFPEADRTERFEQNLSAWETLASRLASEDSIRIQLAFQSVQMSGVSEPIPSVDAALTKALHECVPEALHENAERRILALREKVDAALSR